MTYNGIVLAAYNTNGERTMGRQINFYMSETVQAEFIEFLKQNQFVYYDYYANKVENPADKKLYEVYLNKKNYGEILRKKMITDI